MLTLFTLVQAQRKSDSGSLHYTLVNSGKNLPQYKECQALKTVFVMAKPYTYIMWCIQNFFPQANIVKDVSVRRQSKPNNPCETTPAGLPEVSGAHGQWHPRWTANATIKVLFCGKHWCPSLFLVFFHLFPLPLLPSLHLHPVPLRYSCVYFDLCSPCSLCQFMHFLL